MAEREYHYEPSATIETDDIRVTFHRLYWDSRDSMSDCLKPQWEAEDKFIVDLTKYHTTRTTEIRESKYGKVRIEDMESEILDTMEIRTDSKKVANYIWYLAKHGTSYDEIKAMHEAKKFN